MRHEQAVLKIAVANRLGGLVAMLPALLLCAQCFAQPTSTPKISQIIVDDSLPVLAPAGQTINAYVGGGLPDEHSTILPPGTLPGQPDFLFFVATPKPLTHPLLSNDETLVLRSVSPPASTASWTLDYAPDYGNGAVFLPAMTHTDCPIVDVPSLQDPTFDLNYAGVGTVFLDPTNPKNEGGGNLLMVYEGANRCIGITDSRLPRGNSAYSTIGIATSNDNGQSWPTYRANFTPLPLLSKWIGPYAEMGAWGSNVCWGNYCPDMTVLDPPLTYGRYAVSGPVTTVYQAMLSIPPNSNQELAENTGDSEPSAFVDDVAGGSTPPYVYVVHTYHPGSLSQFPNNSLLYPQPPPNNTAEEFPTVKFDLAISRAQLNGGRKRLQFYHWYNGGFTEPALGSDTQTSGGHETPIFATPGLSDDLNAYMQCLTPIQQRSDGSLSYSQDTHEYVLLFVCTSPTNPKTEKHYPPLPIERVPGGTWFYSTLDADQYDLSAQDHWSAPRQMMSSPTTAFWSPFGTTTTCTGEGFDGWYPSIMSSNYPSPGPKPGYLTSTGWIFFLSGCEAKNPGRTYSTRFFTIITQ